MPEVSVVIPAYGATFVGHKALGPLRYLPRRLRTGPEPVRTVRHGPRDASVNIVHDTTYRRTRRAAARAIHAFDDAIGGLGRSKVRILFEAASPLSLAVFQPVLDQLRSDPQLELWFMTSDASWEPTTIFGRAGLIDQVITPSTARWMKFDVYMNTDFWNMTWLPRRARRVHLFHGVAGKYGLDAPVRIAPVVATFDRLMFPNRDRLRRYSDAGLIDGDSPQAALVGYPKVDCLVDGSLDRRTIEAALGLDPTVPTVLYAPTWSPYSSLNAMGEEVITSLARLDANVVVKLHDRSFDTATRASGGVDWRTYLERLCSRWGVHLAQDANASPYLYAADALVTDHSSVGFEFMLLDRPIVVIDCPELIEKARVNPEKVASLRSAAQVATSARGVLDSVRRGLADPLQSSSARRAIASELFYCPGGATQRAVECIYDLVSLRAPNKLPTDVPGQLNSRLLT